MRHVTSLIFALIIFQAGASAQSINMAIENRGGAAKACTVRELDGSNEATFQMWLDIDSLAPCTLLAQDNFALSIDGNEEIVLQVGAGRASASAASLRDGWAQLTVIFDEGKADFYIDNILQPSVADALPEAIPATAYDADAPGCVIGRGFKGRMDEIRIWSEALAQADFCWRNTVGRYSPCHDALAAYWKCDQKESGRLYDSAGGHHGTFAGAIRRVEYDDNPRFRYRVVVGYTDLMRFIDRPNIDREMYLMTNDVIVLSAKLQDDGSVSMQYPDNSLSGRNVSYLPEHGGRTGLMDFGGEGALMTASDARTLDDPRGAQGYRSSSAVTVEGWIYIDEWHDGAVLFSQYKDASGCLVISLGSKADRALKVNVCGTEAVLDDKLETGKWQYLAVYVKPEEGRPGDEGWSPVRIAVGEMRDGAFFSETYSASSGDARIIMSGSPMSITQFPALDGSTLSVGRDFDGKMDEVKVWGMDRSSRIGQDATETVEWDSGSENIFLNTYWKGDDPDNVGKDYWSYTNMVETMRGFYAGHSGARIRFGLVNGTTGGWFGVLSDPGKTDRFIADCKRLVTGCDGLDVDFEWMYNQSQWDVYNNAVRRLINEVMAGHPDKIFSCSLHNVSYNGFDKSLIPEVDYFTMQLYGPSPATFTLDYYKKAYDNFISWGYPKDKLLLSYGILLTDGKSPVEGYKDLFSKYGFGGEGYDPALDRWDCNGSVKQFCGVSQVRQRQEFIVDNDVRGTMYFDMGNDMPVSDSRSLIRAMNDVIAANVDTVIVSVSRDGDASEDRSCVMSAGPESLIPVPYRYTTEEGVFSMPEGAGFFVKEAKTSSHEEALLLKDELLSLPYGLTEVGNASDADILVTIGGKSFISKERSASAGRYAGNEAESYVMKVTADCIRITAPTAAGAFYAIQDLVQMAGTCPTPHIRCCTIENIPRFGYRGLHFDVSRHFRSKEFLMRQMDAMALLRLNRMHLHLTDGAGWRIEIDRYPRLTEYAAWRPQKKWSDWNVSEYKYCEEGTPGAYGGYYTKDDIKEILDYAARKHIEVIPEIEMPGHSEEVLAAYPELGCETAVHGSDLCPGKEGTFAFLEDVLDEVMELFPSEYIHIGGDEASKQAWKTCPDCRRRMQEEGMADVDELQSYLIHRIEQFVNSRGKKIIGWDEILQGGLAPNATVMSWRGTEGGITALKSGHDVIMTPNTYCYLDYTQDAAFKEPESIGGFITLSRTYSYEPVPEGSSESEASHLLGLQGNMWAEYVTEDSHAEYMYYPRAYAIAETGWSRPETKDYDDFRDRALRMNSILEDRGYNTFDLEHEYGDRKESVTPVRHMAVGCRTEFVTPYSRQYPGSGDCTLTDGLCGGWSYGDGRWLGFLSDMDVIVDLGAVKPVHYVGATFMQSASAWVHYPEKVMISVSDDGVVFRPVGTVWTDFPFSLNGLFYKPFGLACNESCRYVRLEAVRNPAKRGTWLFTDEIVVN